jgi:hypothetical protein
MSVKPDPAKRAIAIRDHLLPLLRAHGAAQEIRGTTGHVEVWRVGRFAFALHSPSNRRQVKTPPPATYDQALAQHRSKPVPAWRLDVWHGDKVMSLRWDDPGALEVATFIRGTWEDAALALRARA